MTKRTLACPMEVVHLSGCSDWLKGGAHIGTNEKACNGLNCIPLPTQSSCVETLTPNVTVFGDEVLIQEEETPYFCLLLSSLREERP